MIIGTLITLSGNIFRKRLKTELWKNKINYLYLFQQNPLIQYFSLSSKNKSTYVCSECGANYVQWVGECTSCQTWGKIMEKTINIDKKNSNFQVTAGQWNISNNKSNNLSVRAFNLEEIAEMNKEPERIILKDKELNWVFGGGVVPGSLTLLAGSPGIGKSTLSLQLAGMLADTMKTKHSQDNTNKLYKKFLYISGEESLFQLKQRAIRLKITSKHLYLINETNINNVIQLILNAGSMEEDNNYNKCKGVIIDSIQTMFCPNIESGAGSVNQVKNSTLRILQICKQLNIPAIVLGHVTKAGDIAGPKVLEHIVDTVLYLEGETDHSNRFLRCSKNRFGSTCELGVFSMTDTGLLPLKNPLMAFLSSDSQSAKSAKEGIAITVAMEGSRPIPVEVQTLGAQKKGAQLNSNWTPSIRSRGVDVDNIMMLMAVLRKAKVRMACYDLLFVNIAQGYTLRESAGDMAVAIALCSSLAEIPVEPGFAFIGEITLSGDVRMVNNLSSRLKAAERLNLRGCVIPRLHENESNLLKLIRENDTNPNFEIVQVDNITQALRFALSK